MEKVAQEAPALPQEAGAEQWRGWVKLGGPRIMWQCAVSGALDRPRMWRFIPGETWEETTDRDLDAARTLYAWALAQRDEVDRLTRERDEARAALARVREAAKAVYDNFYDDQRPANVEALGVAAGFSARREPALPAEPWVPTF